MGSTLSLRDALYNWLQNHGSPFWLAHDTATGAIQRLQAAGADLATWLLEDTVAMALMPYARNGAATAAVAGLRDPLTAAMDGWEDEMARDEKLEVGQRRVLGPGSAGFLRALP